MLNLPITSRMIESVYFSQEDGELHIRFQNGQTRRFEGVPQAEAQALCDAPSPGQHYLDHIRRQFRRLAA